jgi:hypothetical protein
MSYKLLITKPGYNALTETNPNNQIFNSDYNTLKYYLWGSVRINGTWTTNPGDGVKTFTTSVYHGLGYVPFFIAFVNVAGAGYNIIPIYDGVMVRGSKIASVWADSNYLYFDVQLRPGISSYTWNYDVTFYHRIFKNNLGL